MLNHDEIVNIRADILINQMEDMNSDYIKTMSVQDIEYEKNEKKNEKNEKIKDDENWVDFDCEASYKSLQNSISFEEKLTISAQKCLKNKYSENELNIIKNMVDNVKPKNMSKWDKIDFEKIYKKKENIDFDYKSELF
eukprot:GHVL01031955.1.p1 GENE.GHVL01031955.1~~GHVL01031955.1.p1  ORF type:complete len:152 (+),score=56.73 GHVL01031955.1:45-458(+)